MDREDIRDNVRLTSVIEDTNVTDAEINTLINQGLNEIAVQFTWPWLESTATVSLVADTRTASLPNDYLYGGVLVDDDEDSQLPYVSPTTFFRQIGNDTGNSSSNPRMFTIYNDTLYFSPIPDTNDTDRYTFYYYSTVTTLSADDDVPAFNSAFHWILVDYVKWKLYDREEYYDQSERSRVSYISYLSDMIAWYGRSMQRAPLVAGDGRPFTQPLRDLNIPLLNQGF